jgi:ATP-dependent Zn protease
MTTAELAGTLRASEDQLQLASALRRLTRAATFVAVLTSPAVYLWFRHPLHHSIWASVLLTAGSVVAFRGFVDVVTRRLIPWPSLFGSDDLSMREDDVVNRRRAWFWRKWYLRVFWIGGIVAAVVFGLGAAGVHPHVGSSLASQILILAIQLPLLFFVNFAIFFGPLMLMGISQMRGYEPGDADWGVKLADIRGQAEAKEEVRKIVTLWQSGELFEKAGGKRERGLLFHGPPGTGKTMLAKGIATSFNAPFVSMPGSGFAATFIGIDVVIVRWMMRKAKKLARKWGGQCIIFIDEIDAVGMRRQSLQGGNMTDRQRLEQLRQFYGPWGAVNPAGDLIVESQAWRDQLFERRAPEPRSPYPPVVEKLGNIVNQLPGGMMGGMGQLALNQLLVVMDGLDNPPFMRRTLTKGINVLLDAIYVVPRRVGKARLRLPPPRPRKEQIYFIGATNVPLENLDPALTRPGRMGRHVWFRTPTKDDRKDIFALYLGKVAHEPDLDTPQRRDEIARITSGYSPAMIEQVCSLALTYAHHKGNIEFSWEDLLEAMSVIESGAAVNIQYTEAETRAVAIHEAGHAAAAHAYRPEVESSRLSIRMRPGSLGHHQSFEREERFTKWHREYVGDLVHVLGAMAAELVFYDENAGGVSGDLAYATALAAEMAGIVGMGPQPIDFAALRADGESEEQARERVLRRFEQIGLRLMNRTRQSAEVHGDPIASVLRDPYKLRTAAQILGQAFVTAINFIAANRGKIEVIADELVAKRELYGDDLLRILDEQDFVKPELDYAQEATWPRA